ncbi:MAG: hypothetical protein ETSY2_50500 [Candidatus Entotheonella gemina]|uniref:MucR family transcriptional regulator n=1 Tax=Candidatus Entotheonella gemina TaxID=1429439 RepID=W4L9G3_9BACT|nr:MAG: hypothetical protein ETSY2_50500 [Candidatus Entotheonella gemina]
MAKELIIEQIRVYHLSPDDAQALLRSTHATLVKLHQTEVSATTENPKTEAEIGEPDWKRSITKHAITCLECGNTFRQLSSRHLGVHDLTSRSYRRKYGIPSTQPLSSRQATARRRELARQIRPWEQAASMRAGAKTAARTARNRQPGA